MRNRALGFLTAALALSGCATSGDMPSEKVGEAELRFANGLPAGTAQLRRGAEQVTLSVAVTGMSPGAHGFHLHTVGRCDAPGFTSAEGHLNPRGRNHGSLSDGGSHLGDLPNIAVSSNGSGTANVVVGGQRDAVLDEIFDADGTAVIVHADPDDYRTDPSGNTGARIACGVLREG